jgi:hypothetical protein
MANMTQPSRFRLVADSGKQLYSRTSWGRHSKSNYLPLIAEEFNRNHRVAKKFRNLLKTHFDPKDFSKIPRSPGIYIMKDSRERILYIGKATCLRDRVRSYRNAKSKAVGRNIVALLARVELISWEEHANEQAAYERELDLIRAINPPYNIRDAWFEEYFFIGLRHERQRALEFRLTSSNDEDHEYEYFGCFPSRRKVKAGYGALLRLLYACTNEKARFSFPARLARPWPSYKYLLPLKRTQYWKSLLAEFFHGRTDRFLQILVNELLENRTLPEYIRPGLQRDLRSVVAFQKACIEFRERHGIPGENLLTHADLRRSIRLSIKPRLDQVARVMPDAEKFESVPADK